MTDYIRLNNLCCYDRDFEPTKCSGCIHGKVSTVWTSTDPRLVSSGHSGQRLVLDSPPRNGKEVCPQENLYRNYGDITLGDVSYYIDKQLATPFLPQLFTGMKNLVMKEEYVDPMGSYKPHYYICQEDTNNCLSWLKDSQFHRQNLMASQVWRRNQTDFATNSRFK